MACYKSILSAMVLVLLFSLMTIAMDNEEKKKKARECYVHAVLSCRNLIFVDNSIEITKPTTEHCIKTALKFWVETIDFPEPIKDFYKMFEGFIKKNKLLNRQKFCEKWGFANRGAYYLCILALEPFGDTVDSALRYALQKKRIIDFLPDATIVDLNTAGLAFDPQVISDFPDSTIRDLNQQSHNFTKKYAKYDYEYQIAGLKNPTGSNEAGSSGAGSSGAGLSENSTYISEEFLNENITPISEEFLYEATGKYMAHFIDKLKLNSEGDDISPLTYCARKYFKPGDDEYIDPYKINIEKLFVDNSRIGIVIVGFTD